MFPLTHWFLCPTLAPTLLFRHKPVLVALATAVHKHLAVLVALVIIPALKVRGARTSLLRQSADVCKFKRAMLLTTSSRSHQTFTIKKVTKYILKETTILYLELFKALFTLLNGKPVQSNITLASLGSVQPCCN